MGQNAIVTSQVSEKGSQLKAAHRKEDQSYGALILCAGSGTRLSALTGGTIPKPLYKVGGKELISYCVNLLEGSKVDKLVFGAGNYSAQIGSWVSAQKFSCEVVIIDRHCEMSALICEAAAIMHRDNVVISGADEIIRGLSVAKLIEHHELSGSLLTVPVTDPKNAIGNGVLMRLDHGRVVELRENREANGIDLGSGEWMQHAGLIVMNQKALKLLPLMEKDPNKVVDMPTLRGGVASGILNAYVDRDVVFFNINTPEEVELANRHLQAKRAAR